MTKLKYYCINMVFCAILLLTSTPVFAASRLQEMETPVVIVIDPGHGGENLGTIENGFLEKDMTLKTAIAMYNELCLYDDVTVYMTKTEDVDLTLKSRAEFAASVNADFLFSIHYNASIEHDLFGSEIWISAQPPYNAYGYQFGCTFLQEMDDLGLYLRGIKTRLNDNGNDYYGIIRESVALSIPAVILEHCHVDESRDYSFCDTDEKLEAFGRADATAVARYFGLKSTALDVDYSQENQLPDVNKDSAVKNTLLDETPPDVCIIDVTDTDENTGKVVLSISAADYDSPLIYFDYSIDSGTTYSSLQAWPESNVLTGTYRDTFTYELSVPSGIQPQIILRAYNLFDGFTESNMVSLPYAFSYGEAEAEESFMPDSMAETSADDSREEKALPGTTTFMPILNENTGNGNNDLNFLIFLKLCLVIVIIILVMVILSQALVYRKRCLRRRQRMKDTGDIKNQLR